MSLIDALLRKPVHEWSGQPYTQPNDLTCVTCGSEIGTSGYKLIAASSCAIVTVFVCLYCFRAGNHEKLGRPSDHRCHGALGETEYCVECGARL